MRNLQKIDHWLGHFYRFGVTPVTGYVNAESELIPSAPLIHSYSPSLTCILPSLAIAKPSTTALVEGQTYRVKHFLTVQKLDHDLCFDEDGDFRPTVKPHYVLAPHSERGTQYNLKCPTLLTEDQSILFQESLPVHAHDQRLSPAITIEPLKEKMLTAFKEDSNLFLNSYVVDTVNKEIIITQHCLLRENEHDDLLQALETTKTIEALAGLETPIKKALEHYDSDALETMQYLTQAVTSKQPSPTLNQQTKSKSSSVNKTLINMTESMQIRRTQLINAVAFELQSFKDEMNQLNIPDDKYKNIALNLHIDIQDKLECFKTHEDMAIDHFLNQVKQSFNQALPKLNEGTTLFETVLNFFIHFANKFLSEQNRFSLFRPAVEPVVKDTYTKMTTDMSFPDI